MKRELKEVSHFRPAVEAVKQVSRLIPMKRELKGSLPEPYRKLWLQVSRLIPMKRELKDCIVSVDPTVYSTFQD